MLLTNINYPTIYQTNIYDVIKEKISSTKCMALSQKFIDNLLLNERGVDIDNDEEERYKSKVKFRFCVCSGFKKNNNKKPTSKWYIKVRLDNFYFDIFIVRFKRSIIQRCKKKKNEKFNFWRRINSFTICVCLLRFNLYIHNLEIVEDCFLY